MTHISLPTCAPYSVYLDEGRTRFVARVASLLELNDLLARLAEEHAEDYHRQEDRRNAAYRWGNPWRYLPLYREFRAVVVDCRGVLRADLNSSWNIRRFFSPLKSAIDFGWDGERRPRGFPVPGTGRRTAHCSYMRYPKTQRDRRWGVAVSDEGEPPIRGPRTAKGLPTAWDDQPRNKERGWKRHRATQWHR